MAKASEETSRQTPPAPGSSDSGVEVGVLVSRLEAQYLEALRLAYRANALAAATQPTARD